MLTSHDKPTLIVLNIERCRRLLRGAEHRAQLLMASSLVEAVRAALARINPHVPTDALDEALRRLLNVGHDTPNLIENNRRWHQLLVNGVDVEFKRPDGSIAGDKVWQIDSTAWPASRNLIA